MAIMAFEDHEDGQIMTDMIYTIGFWRTAIFVEPQTSCVVGEDLLFMLLSNPN
jgi:hypothetical protein